MKREQMLKEFERTRDFHHGRVEVAAALLGLKPESLARALYRARKAGVSVAFTQQSTVRRFR